jgi:hypothetical protein
MLVKSEPICEMSVIEWLRLKSGFGIFPVRNLSRCYNGLADRWRHCNPSTEIMELGRNGPDISGPAATIKLRHYRPTAETSMPTVAFAE